MDAMEQQDASVMVLGAGLGGAHVVKALLAARIPIRGVYDQSNDAPGVVLARRCGVPVYSGSYRKIDRLFQVCAEDDQRDFQLFLSSRDPRFIAFVELVAERWKRNGTKNFQIFRLGEDFEDYAHAYDLLALTC